MITFAPFPDAFSSRRRKAVDRLSSAIHALTRVATPKPSPPRSRGRPAVADPGKGPRPHRRGYNALPLALLTPAAIILTTDLPPWLRMWLIAFALFAGFKWWTLQSAQDFLVPRLRLGAPPDSRETPSRANFRPLAYLCLWPGTSARAFLNTAARPPKPTTAQWTWALTKTLLGALLLWCAARLFLPTQINSENSVIPFFPSVAGNTLAAGWLGMIGFIFLLHFGLFDLLALFWQSRGIDAPPLMKCPIAASSLHDFWGRRWNAGFRDIVFPLFFFPLARRFGASMGALLTFILSGLIHELVITIPAGAGYGLPTLYFTLQGLGLMLERNVAAPVRAWTISQGAHGLTAAETNQNSAMTPVAARVSAWPSRLFAWAFVVLPIAALFPPVFVERVMVPFFQLLHAL